MACGMRVHGHERGRTLAGGQFMQDREQVTLQECARHATPGSATLLVAGVSHQQPLFEAHAGTGREVELSAYACLEPVPVQKSGPRIPQAEVRRLSFVMATPEIHKLRGVPERRSDDCVLLDLMAAAGLSPRPAAPAPGAGDPDAILPVRTSS